MKKEFFEEKMTKVRVGVTYYCDVCQKEIKRHKGFYRLMTGHNDWGHDSCDSIKHFELCSKECLQKKFDEYKERSNGAINTEYFEVDHEKGYYNPREEE